MAGARDTVGGSKVLVPVDGPDVVARPRLDERLADVDRRRLTLLTAAPGMGKTTLLAQWSRRAGAAWYTVTPDDRDPTFLARGLLQAARLRAPALDPGAVAPSPAAEAWVIPAEGQGALAADQVVGMLTERLERDLVLVVDDAQQLAGAESSCRFLGDLVRAGPARLHLVLSSRLDPPFAVARLRAQGLAADLPGSVLRFTEEETALLVGAILGGQSSAVAPVVHRATAGWPAAARLVAEWLRPAPVDQRPALVARLGETSNPVEAFLVEDVLPATPPEVVELVRNLVSLARFTPGLAGEVAGAGAEELVGLLARDGLWVVPDETRDGWFVVPPLLRSFVRSRLAVRPDDTAVVLRRAEAWLEGRGERERALAGLLTDPCVEAGARLIQGDYDTALELVAPFLEGESGVPMSAGVVAGLAHHFRGRLAEAAAIYDRALAGEGSEALRALVLGWAAGAAWLQGDLERCRQLTKETGAAAGRAGDDRAWAMAYTARAMVCALEGDREAMQHYQRALRHAEAANDHVQIVRIRTNRGSRFLSEGYYREALVELDEAVRLADLAGIALFRPLTLANRGEALMGLGRLDEAARELEAAKAFYEGQGSRMASYPLTHLGTVHRLQGHVTLACGHYEEAISIGEASGDHQGLVPALAGLALLQADTDPEQAAAMAARAAEVTSLARPEALIAAAEVALKAGDTATAAARAAEASLAARRRRDRPALAEALEVQARVLDDAGAAAGLLEEARTVWAEIGNPLGEARVLLAQARLGGPGAPAAAAEAEQTLRRLGARTLAAEAARVQADLDRAARPPLLVRVLGGFAVERDGVPVPAADWQSRKARDLLKILIARRGRPVTRDALIDLLWADEDLAKAGSRLSVTLSTLRSVLDPSKRFDAEHFVANDRAAAWLRLEHVAVDVEAFLADARAGLDALAAGHAEMAGALLAKAEAAYAGDFLEEDPYEDWAVVVREEARATYVAVAMALADRAGAAGDHDGAARYLLRVLSRDSYDERAHLQLVAALSAAGRHGEARRMYRAYCDRMADIDVEPSPFPDTRPRRPTPVHPVRATIV
ncbi:MAG TPA: BTAD domain-containing putative transcriptional regulator [Acidimicrobiales bacterium]|nr:BTAD domain-containing putative transcriptional regulator [Acidimicrobiales bacterium]